MGLMLAAKTVESMEQLMVESTVHMMAALKAARRGCLMAELMAGCLDLWGLSLVGLMNKNRLLF
jgi:hypothetical protein